MADWEIGIQIDETFQGSLGEEWLRGLVNKVLTAEGFSGALELGLVVADDVLVRQLNRDYRGRDEPTDVLAFPLFSPQPNEPQPSFVLPPDEKLQLGEVVVCYPQAARQAAEQQHPLEAEIALLVVHGVLHLLGYDHEEPEQERLMRDREKEILGWQWRPYE